MEGFSLLVSWLFLVVSACRVNLPPPPDRVSQRLCSKVNVRTEQIRQGKGKRGGFLSDYEFVLGGGAALGGRVGVRLVADRHLHGEAQPLLVDPPVEAPALKRREDTVCTCSVTHGLTLCASRRPGSRSRTSTPRFCPLCCGC